MIEDEIVRWHHQVNEHEFEQAPGAGDGQGSLACCSPWGLKESDTTERLNCTEMKILRFLFKGQGRSSPIRPPSCSLFTSTPLNRGIEYWG